MPNRLFQRSSAQASGYGKIIGSVFWDSEGILLIDYLEHGKKINMDNYAGLFRKLKASIMEKRRGKMTMVPLLLHVNA